MADDIQKTKQIIELLRQTSSLGVVSEFLKSKGLRHSAGSWEDMEGKRLLPAITANEISNADLISLLRSAEECGKQHVFLYSCDAARAQELFDRARITAILGSLGKTSLLTEPEVLNQPTRPTIVDVRWESADVDLRLTIKEIELRLQQRYLGTEQDGDKIKKVYQIRQERVVNVARLHRNGLLEIRIGSHANSSQYKDDINRFWAHVSSFLPRADFLDVSLSTAKARLLTERTALLERIRYTDSTLRNDNGVVLRAATGSEANDLGQDAGAQASLDTFIAHDAYCEGHNFHFKAVHGLKNAVHVIMTGALNEFAVPANCSQEDYEYVLDQVRSLNR